MNLIIENPTNENLDEFIYTKIIPEIQALFLYQLDNNRCYTWTEYFKYKDLGWIKYKNNKTVIPTAYDILIAGINNLRCLNHKNRYIIEINPNEIAPKTSAKLIDICSLINYGNLDMSPYPIFEDTFRYVANHLQDYYNEYLEE